MNTLASLEFTAYIGIDWSDTHHDICLQPAGTDEREFERIAHQPKDIEQWAHSIHKRFGGPIAVALELSKGPIVSALQRDDFFVLIPVNPSMLAKYREAFKPSGAKDDPTDAALAVDLVVRHPERFKPLQPQSAEMRTLVHLVEKRRRLVEDRRRFSNRLISALKAYFPQAVEWFSHKETFVFCAFITRWPTLKHVKRARRSTLERFFREHNVRRPLIVEARIQAIKAATPLTEDPAVIEPYALEALALVEQLRTALEVIKRFDEAIVELLPRLPDHEVFSSLPGAGPVLIPRLVAAFGEDRERFHSAAEVQRYSGIAPVTERSGNTSWVH
jgi:transposase